jgi:hypothetical protein
MSLGPVSPSKRVLSDVMASMSEAMQYLQANELSLAEDAYAAALDSAESSLGEDHQMTLRALECMARCCKMQGKMDLAVPMYERLVEIKDKQAGGRVETSLAVVYAELGECYEIQGRVEDANKMKSRSSKVMRSWEEKQEEEKSAAKSDEEELDFEGGFDDDDDEVSGDAKGEN